MIACAGDALIDFVPAHSESGEDAFIPRVGGSCLNVAVALARLGAPTALISGVSTDLFGEMIETHLAEAGVSLDLLARSVDETTLAFVKMDGGDARYAFYDEHSAGRRWAVPPQNLPLARFAALHVGSVNLIHDPSAGAYEALVEAARERTIISFDPNCRPTLVADIDGYRARMARIAGMSHIVRFSEEDFEFVFPGANSATMAAQWLAANACVVLITRGPGGAIAWSRGGHAEVEAAKVELADTIGAGDTFQAAFIFSLYEAGLLEPAALASMDSSALHAAMAFATRAAAITCSRIGCDPPTRAELA